MQGAVYSLFGWPVHTTIARPHHGRLHLLRRAQTSSRRQLTPGALPFPHRSTAPPPGPSPPADRPAVPGEHPRGFQGNDSRPIREPNAGLRLVGGARGGSGPSAFDLKIWRGKPDRGWHRPVAARGLSAGKPAPGTTASPPLPLARPLLSARELSSSLYGPWPSEKWETAPAAAALPNPFPVPGRPGARSLCVSLTCQFPSRLEPTRAEPGLLGTSSSLRLWSPRVGPSACP